MLCLFNPPPLANFHTHGHSTDIACHQDNLLVFIFFISIPICSNSNLISNSSSISNLF
jgi:hypothetical protein